MPAIGNCPAGISARRRSERGEGLGDDRLAFQVSVQQHPAWNARIGNSQDRLHEEMHQVAQRLGGHGIGLGAGALAVFLDELARLVERAALLVDLAQAFELEIARHVGLGHRGEFADASAASPASSASASSIVGRRARESWPATSLSRRSALQSFRSFRS